MTNFIKKNKWFLLVGLFLFLIPFFWFSRGKIDLGGDSTRFYFYDPYSWLTNIALYFVNPLKSLGEETPNFLMVPFLLILSVLKQLLGSGYNLNNFFNGFLLASSFLIISTIIREFIDSKDNEIEQDLGAIVGGLFFVFSPLLIYDWERALNAIHQIFVYPLVFFLFLRYLKTNKILFLIFISPITFIFAVNFSYGTVPWLVAFFSFSFLFLFLYSLINKKALRFAKGILFCVLFFLISNSFDIIPQIFNIIDLSGSSHSIIFDLTSRSDWGIPYFQSVANHVRLLYNITNQPQYVITSGFNHMVKNMVNNYGIRFLPIFFIYPLFVCFGMIVKEKVLDKKQRYLVDIICLFFLVLVYFMTANITTVGQSLYKTLFYLPGFSMFRSFYTKFAMTYVFFYSVLLSFSFYSICVYCKTKKTRKFCVTFFTIFLLIICFNGWPLISGQIVNGRLWQSNNVSVATEVDPEYIEFSRVLKDEKVNAKILSLPFADENYQLLQGKTGGAYFGPSTITILTAKNSFNGLRGFSIFWPQVKELFEKKDYKSLEKFLSLFNIGYAFHNNDDYVYENFPSYPYGEWIKTALPTQETMEDFLIKTNFIKTYFIGKYNLYKKEKNFLPHFYVAKKIVNTNNGIDAINEIISFDDFDIRSGIFFGNSVKKQEENDILLAKTDNNEHFVEGIGKDIPYLSLYEGFDGGIGEGISYTYVRNKPLFIWYLGLLNESYQTNLYKGNVDDFVKKKIFYANKRINELKTLKYEEPLKQNFRKIVQEEIDTLSKIEDSDKRTRLAFEVLRNLEDNLRRIEKYSLPSFETWQELIGEYITLIKESTKKFVPTERIYQTDIPSSGNYELFVKENGKSNNSYLLETINNCSFGTGENSTVVEKKIEEKQDGWLKFGDVFLKGGKSELKLKFNEFPNLAKETEWKAYEPSFEEKKKGEISIDGFQLPEASKYLYVDIPQWEAGEWYQVSGEIRSDIKAVMLSQDSYFDWAEGQLNKKEIIKYSTSRQIKIDQGTQFFNIYLRPKPKTKGGKIFIFPEERNVPLRDISISVENFKVLRLPNPKIVLRSKTNVPLDIANNTIVPQITFTKINPTKYKINVKNAISPYTLIFSENFHNGWKIFSGEKTSDSLKTIDKMINKFTTNIGNKLGEENNSDSIMANHFNSDIKEGEHKMSFLDNSTFANWGRIPIADNRHSIVNGYANSWYILPSDNDGKNDYELSVEFVPQRLFYTGLVVSVLFFVFCFIFIIKKIFFRLKD